MIVWIASFPRSGNNLCLLTLSKVFDAETGSALNPESLRSRLSLDRSVDLRPALRELDETVFVKTHRTAEPADDDPALYLVRDGRDSLVSYAHFMQARGDSQYESLSFEETLAALIEREDHPYGSWSANVRSWLDRDAPTQVLRFEELIEDPVRAVRRAMRALRINLPEPLGRLPSFGELHERNPLVFRRGKVGSWRSELPKRLEKRFWRLHGAEMEELGYRR
jgi:sulfotransferase family protein